MENVDELIEQYRQEAAQFTLSPRPAVWQHIDAEINPPRRKRRFFFIWWLLGCLAAYGFYAVGTRYVAHSTVAHQQSRSLTTTQQKPLPVAAASAPQTIEKNKTHNKQKRTSKKKTAITTGIAGTQATTAAQTAILKKEKIRPSIVGAHKGMASNKPTLPVAAPVTIQAVWPYPIHRLAVLQPKVPVPVIKPHQPRAVSVPAITAMPISILAANSVQQIAVAPTKWESPLRGVVPAIMYPATEALPCSPTQLLPNAARMATPGSAMLPVLAAPKQYLQPMADLYSLQLLPTPYHQLGTASLVANPTTPYTYTSLVVLPAHAKPIMASPQTLQTLPLASVGKILGSPVHSIDASAPAHLPTPTTSKTSAPLLPPATVYANATTTSMAPMPHVPLPVAAARQHGVVAHRHDWVLQASASAPITSPAFGPAVYPTFETYNEEPEEKVLAEFEQALNVQRATGTLASLQKSSLLLLAATPHAHPPGIRKMPANAQTTTDTPTGKSTNRRWALEIAGGPSFNKHTITESGQYQFIRSYRDSTDARIRTAQWSVGLRYAVNSRVSFLLSGSLLQTGEEINSRQRAYSTDTVLVNISSVGPTFASQTIMIVGKNYDINGDSTSRLRNTVAYATLGVGIRYHLLAAGKLSMGMQPSASLAWRTAGRMYAYDSTAQEWRVATKKEMSPRNGTVGFGLYAEYRLSPAISVSVMPHYTRFIGPALRQSPVGVQYSQTSVLGTVTWWFR